MLKFFSTLRANSAVYFAFQAANVAVIPLLTHLVRPDQLAAWFLWFNVVALLSTIGTLRYELAIVTARTQEEGAALVLAGAAIAGILAVVVLAGVAVWMALVPGISLLTLGVFAVGAGACGAINQVLSAWNLRQGRVVLHTALAMSPSLGTVIAQMLFAVAGMGEPTWLVFGGLCGYAGPAAVALAVTWHRDFRSFSQLRWAHIRTAISMNRRYPYYSVPFTAAGLLRERAIYVVLGLVGDPTALSLFALSHRLVSLANAIVSAPLRPVFFQFAARMGMERAKVHIDWLLRVLSTLVVPAWIGVLLWAPELLQFALGPQWAAAAPYLRLLSVPFFIVAISAWLDRVYDVLADQRLIFLMEAIFSLIMVVALVVGLAYSRDPLFLTIILAAVSLIYGWVWLAVTYARLALAYRGVAILAGIHAAVGVGVTLLHYGGMRLGGPIWASTAVGAAVLGLAIYGLREAKTHLRLTQ